MLRKDIKTFIRAIRNHSNQEAIELLDRLPDLVAATAKSPPKKDDGQSPLQIASKTGNFEIANLLVELGADVNFMEESDVNVWRVPVLHDAIRAAMFNTKKLQEDVSKFASVLGSLELLWVLGS